jgi:hypothetical protein
LATRKRFMAINITGLLISTAWSNQINRSSARGARGVSQDDLSFLLDRRPR